jgi:mannose-1-phosphate guanylyltransferase
VRRELSRRSSGIKAVILAGGLGTRLRPYTLFVPKPMLPVGHMPILERILEWLKKNDIDQVVLSTGYLGHMIEDYFKDGAEFGLNIEYASSRKPLGIAGQLRSAQDKLGSRFVCLYGDAILDFDLKKLIKFHEKKQAMLTMALMAYKMQGKYGVIELKGDGRIGQWKEKPVVESDINIGCYVMEKRYLSYIPRDSVYGMKEAFEDAMSKHEALYGLKVSGAFWDIGDKKAYLEADAHYSKQDGKIP